MSLVASNVIRKKSGGGAGNNLGGQMNNADISNNVVNNIWRKITLDETITGITIFRGFYIYNSHTSEPLRNVVVYFSTPVTNTGIEVSLGHGISAVGSTQTETPIATETTIPPVRNNEWFVNPKSRTEALTIDRNITPLGHAFVWMRMTVPPGTTPSVFTHYRMRIEAFNQDAASNIPETWGMILAAHFTFDTNCEDTLLEMSKRDFNVLQTVGNNMINMDITQFRTLLNRSGLRPKTRVCIGRYDAEDITKVNALKTEFGIPAQGYYSYNIHNAHFTVMNFENDYFPDVGTQYNWVKQDLEKARTASGIDWIIVIVNDAMYGHHSAYDRDTRESLRDLYHELFMANQVHVVISGAAPRYERHLILAYNTSDADNPLHVQEDQDPNYTWFGDGFEAGASMFINVGNVGGNIIRDDGANTGYTKFVSNVNRGYLHLQFSNFGQKLFLLRYTEGSNLTDKPTITHTLPP